MKQLYPQARHNINFSKMRHLIAHMTARQSHSSCGALGCPEKEGEGEKGIPPPFFLGGGGGGLGVAGRALPPHDTLTA